jgi:uncharacterized protein YbjT (DUF2867 family)
LRIFLTGATGFTGGHLLPLLLQRGWTVRCYVRNPGQVAALERKGAGAAIGDLGDVVALRRGMEGCDTLVNVASMGFGHVEGIISTAEGEGIQRAVFISTTAIFTSLKASSKKTRLEAEQRVQQSRLAWTILRPTMIYGDARDRNMCRLVRFLGRIPVVPVIGTGEFLMQPVHVDDVAGAIVLALNSKETIGKCYTVSGHKALTYNEVVRTAARQMGRNPWIVHFPARPMAWVLNTLESLRIRVPIKAEQIERLNEDKAFPWEDAARDFGYTPRTFEAGIGQEIASMGLAHQNRKS